MTDFDYVEVVPMEGVVATLHDFILLTRRIEGEDFFHCFIGLLEDNQLLQDCGQNLWENQRIAIKRSVWSTIRGPQGDSSWGNVDTSRLGLICWFGFEVKLPHNEMVYCDIDAALFHLRVAAEVLAERLPQDNPRDQRVTSIGYHMARGMGLTWDEDLKDFLLRTESRKRYIEMIEEIFEWEDETIKE